MPQPYYSHSVLEQVKIPVVIDGDLALTLLNIIGQTADDETLDDLLYCGHTGSKLEALVELLDSKTDIENKEQA